MAGAVVQTLDYLPFGSERVNIYGARYYHPTLGRFTQPDPVIIDTSRKEFAVAVVNPQ